MWAHKEGSQPEHKAIKHGEIRRTLSGAIADQELMFEQERFSCDLARAARAEEFREGHEQMDRQEEQIAYELKLSCRPTYARLHHSGDLCQSCQFATHRTLANRHEALQVKRKLLAAGLSFSVPSPNGSSSAMKACSRSSLSRSTGATLSSRAHSRPETGRTSVFD